MPSYVHITHQTNVPSYVHITHQTNVPSYAHITHQTNVPSYAHITHQTNVPSYVHITHQTNVPSYVHITHQTNAVKVTERMIPCIRACHAAHKATNAQTYLWCVSYGIKLMSEKQDKIKCRSNKWQQMTEHSIYYSNHLLPAMQCASELQHTLLNNIK